VKTYLPAENCEIPSTFLEQKLKLWLEGMPWIKNIGGESLASPKMNGFPREP